jgi:twitching motility protein PilT
LVPVFELLLNTGAVANLIRENRTHEIDTIIEMGSKDGMIDLDRYLAGLVRDGILARDTAYTFARRRSLFDRLL